MTTSPQATTTTTTSTTTPTSPTTITEMMLSLIPSLFSSLTNLTTTTTSNAFIDDTTRTISTTTTTTTTAATTAFDITSGTITSSGASNTNNNNNSNNNSDDGYQNWTTPIAALATDTTSNTTTTVNMTDEEIQDYIKHLQDEEFKLYIPAMTVIIIIGVVGLLGNSLVLLVYKTKFHRTPTRIFIMVIASFDLLSNTLLVPADVLDMFHLWNFTLTDICKIIRYSQAGTTISSACILLALSVARYKKICRPFGRQVTTRHAKVLCVFLIVGSWVISIPHCILNGTHTRPTQLPGVVGKECTIDDRYQDTIWPLVNNGLFLLLFLSMTVPLVVLYSLIGVTAYRHKKTHGVPVATTSGSATTCTVTMSTTEDVLDNKPSGPLSRLIKRKQNIYNVSGGNSEVSTLKLKHSKGGQKAGQKEGGDEGNSNLKNEKDAGKKGGILKMPTKQHKNGAVPIIRSPKGEKTEINFAMVHELTTKLNRIKGSETSDNVNEEMSESLSDAFERNTDLDNETNTGDNCFNNVEKKSDCDQETGEEENENSKPISGLATRLQWIDLAYSCNEINDEPEKRVTPAKKTSLSRKLSRENSLLQKQRKFIETLTNNFARVRAPRKEKKGDYVTDDDLSDEDGEVTNKKHCSTPDAGIVLDSWNEKQNGGRTRRNTLANNETKSSNSKSKERGVINRTTRMLILITSVYVLSYIPYLVLVFFRFTQPESFSSMSRVSVAIHHIFLRFYYVNSGANAIIYSFCDINFRRHTVSIFKSIKTRCKCN